VVVSAQADLVLEVLVEVECLAAVVLVVVGRNLNV
jgi:hypothetical protein